MTSHHLLGSAGLFALACAITGCAANRDVPSAAATPEPNLSLEAPPPDQEVLELAELPPIVPRKVDLSGRKQQGRASFYARHFDGRKMANGDRFDPNSDVAASKTLPLGTVAKVTNLDNGRSAVVKVGDRGPYARGRIVDLTPKVAERLEMQQAGVAPVVVAPIAVPQTDGAVKLGAGAAEAGSPEVAAAVQVAKTAGR